MQHCYITQCECLVLEANWSQLADIINNKETVSPKINNSNKVQYNNLIKKFKLFSHLNDSETQKLSKNLNIQVYEMNEIIFLQGSVGLKFYMIIKGHVRILRNNNSLSRDIETGNWFGEIELINEEKRSATAIALSKAKCYTLDKKDFIALLDDKMMDTLKTKMCLKDSEIEIEDLYFCSVLGKGNSGKVFLAYNYNFLYAVKVVSKNHLLQDENAGKYLISEKDILMTIDNPFIVKFVLPLKTSDYFLLVLEYVQGIDMGEYIKQKVTKYNYEELKFYAASILIALNYLNSKNIIHRDIKPKNIMINSDGYIKLIDFGDSKRISNFTYTVIGTPHYIAPEVLSNQGYYMSADYWSAGITLYYLFYGILPFGNDLTDPMDIYNEVINK